MRRIDVNIGEKTVITGDLSELLIRFGNHCEAEIHIGKTDSRFEFRGGSKKLNQSLPDLFVLDWRRRER